MKLEEAWKIIEELRGWNTSQAGFSAEECLIMTHRRNALAKAWEAVGSGQARGEGSK